MNSTQDTIYAQACEHISDFQFDDRVAGVFSDMIRRSVPGYGQIINTLGDFADKCVSPDSNIYDLGCSLGAATLSVRRRIEGRGCHIIAVDNSESMVERCRQHLNAYVSETPVDLVCADIRDIDIQNASMVILNFTMQFLAPEDRQTLIANIYRGLKPGGILVLSEKLVFDDAPVQHLLDELHLDFKRANGYSELEISQKRSSLEHVMKPDTLEQHQQRLTDQGFSHFSVWFQCFNFASMVAIK
ncbi:MULTISPECIES: carboxy-S-adenosyl-L-methionine synthase CmoA [Shewanella]|uniref:Carboxy-S-adenosyl-L-methionine synthase n=1 Tax=Shewanella marisflavi TaxID=260364 RepID=A0AAC9U026_9GAMM|nr:MULTISPECIES: carboxy-S-adenosyl-L-methionine synthase CmoA [Shewanella]ASJ96689.1 tRNA (cmo5U34)-methyltransferase [Shewanella marisflavi]MCL1041240.1 carboxy-S-adenosyl-L-methionine synthase CmoA [Shewanella marisflavi]QDF75210.1 carboxy-S-adenosyl-L-methionine synthase CmoA [Shewanella marisflavi]